MKTFTRLILIVVLCFAILACNTQKKIAKKNEKLETFIQREAIYYDVDFKSMTSGNLSQQYKESMTRSILEITPDEIKEDISEFMKAYSGPELQEPPQYLIDEIYDSIRRERKIVWADALAAFGNGMQGNSADKNVMYSTQIRNQRGMLYLKLKEIDDQNKVILAEWDKYFIDDLLKYVAIKMATRENGWIKFKDEVEYISM